MLFKLNTTLFSEILFVFNKVISYKDIFIISNIERIKHLKKNAAIKVFDDLVESNSEEVKK